MGHDPDLPPPRARRASEALLAALPVAALLLVGLLLDGRLP